MPKRYGYLYEKIYEWDNLLLAYRKTKKGKTNKAEVLEFEYDLENNLIEIQDKFKQQKYQFSGYKTFQIYEPKERTICCAPFHDRVVHHAVCNIINPILDKSIISDSYACRKGKGLHKAVRRAFYFYQNNEYCYKFDIRKYFYTIDHQILQQKLSRKFKDSKLMNLFSQLLSTYHSKKEYYFAFDNDDLFDLIRERGLPIGNLTSQIFANFFLSDLDHFVKEKLHQRNYIRYMDDILIFSNKKGELKKVQVEVIKKLAESRLLIHPHKNIITKTTHGVNFLGFRYKNNIIKLQNQNLRRFKKNLRKRAKKELPVSEQLLSLNGNLGYLLGGFTKKIINNVLNEIEFRDENKMKYKFCLKGNFA